MPTAETTYLGDLRTQSIHLRSGNQIVTDAPTDNQGRGEAFSPTDLLATSLGACMLTIMGIKARNDGFSIEGTRLEISKIMASDPRRVASVEILFFMPDISYSDKQKEALKRAAMNCPVVKSLLPDLIQKVSFHFHE